MEEEQILAGEMRTLSSQDESHVQYKDTVCRRVTELIRNGVSKYGKKSRKVRLGMREQKRLFLENKTLYRLTLP